MTIGVLRKIRRLPALPTLFLLAVILLPGTVAATRAAPAAAPDHLLTYTTGALTWDGATAVGADGAALLDLFDASYQNVQADNGDNLVAPGTEKTALVQLKNDAGNPIRYTALLYRVCQAGTLPVAPQLTGTGFADTGIYPLPDGIGAEQVVRAVTGTLEAGAAQDFAVTWGWSYYEDDARDALDTALGDKAAFVRADEVTAGLYIVVEDESSGTAACIRPGIPQTGDAAPLRLYAVLLAGSGLLLGHLVRKRREAER